MKNWHGTNSVEIVGTYREDGWQNNGEKYSKDCQRLGKKAKGKSRKI